MDPRLRAAVDASVRWYDDVFALHGVAVVVQDGLWTALGPPPAWHSAVKTVEPDVDVDAVLRAMELHEHGSVADSFGALDLAPHGFDLLIDATWLHRPAATASGGLPAGWSVVTQPGLLDDWNDHNETITVLLPPLLDHPHFTFLARHEGDLLTAGAVLHLAGPTVLLSNSWSIPGRYLDLREVVACVDALHPGSPAIDYAWDEELAALRGLGFDPVGPQRVWIR